MNTKTIPPWLLSVALLVPTVACGGDDGAPDDEILPDAGMDDEDLEPDAEPEPVAVCGNGIIESDEVCDGAALGGNDCVGLGYASGDLHCRADCTPDRTECDVAPFELTASVDLAIADNTYDGSLASMTCVDLATGPLPTMYARPDFFRLTLGIDHPYLGDLVVKLVPPGQAPQTLLHRPGLAETMDDGAANGGNGANLAAGSPITLRRWTNNGPSAELMGAGLAGSATACLSDGKCEYTASPAPGTFAMAVAPAEGTWQVCVGDAGPADVGTLKSVKLALESLSPVPDNIYRDAAFSSYAIDKLYDGTIATMTCGSATFPEGTGQVGDLEVSVIIQHPKAGDLTIALVDPDGNAYGLVSRPGTLEDANAQAVDPGAAVYFSSFATHYFGIGRFRDVPLAETIGDGLMDGDSVCGSDCAFIADRGTSALAAPAEVLGRPIAGTWQVCFGDSTVPDAGAIDIGARIDITPTE